MQAKVSSILCSCRGIRAKARCGESLALYLTSCNAGVEVAVSKAAVEPVWYLPGVAERFGMYVLRSFPSCLRLINLLC